MPSTTQISCVRCTSPDVSPTLSCRHRSAGGELRLVCSWCCSCTSERCRGGILRQPAPPEGWPECADCAEERQAG